MRDFAEKIIEAARELRDVVDRIKFKSPVTHVYNPLDYAWRGHEAYLRKFARSRKQFVFLGMNPGPFGMVQTGVPFGEISAVRAWMRIEATVDKPRREHPERPVDGFACQRSEVSGKRLRGLFADRFGLAEDFFADHFVINYCPLAFFDNDGRNLTPDKLPVRQVTPLFAACDRHLRRAVEILRPEWLIGIGGFAEKRARLLLAQVGADRNPPLTPPSLRRAEAALWRAAKAERGTEQRGRFCGSLPRQGPQVGLSALGRRNLASAEFSPREAPGQRTPCLKIGRILHPSPASPAANKDWARKATRSEEHTSELQSR